MAYIGKQPIRTALTSSDIEDGVITAAKIEDGAVVAAEIASNAVTTAKINADAVTGAKIADDQINSEHYVADSIDAEHYAAGSVDTTALGADAVTAAKIADNAISEEHLDSTIITGLTALAEAPADTDEFLVSDGGTLKKIDYSYIKGSTVSTLDIDGATDIGADIADADLFLVDDGAGGTNRKAAASRIKTYVGTAYEKVATSTDLGSGSQTIYSSMANKSGIILVRNRTRGHKSPVAFYGRGGGGIGFYYVMLSLDDGWEVETSANSVSFQEAGADVNTYTVAITTGGGVLTVERTNGSQNYDVSVYTLDLNTD